MKSIALTIGLTISVQAFAFDSKIESFDEQALFQRSEQLKECIRKCRDEYKPLFIDVPEGTSGRNFRTIKRQMKLQFRACVKACKDKF